MLRLGDLGLDDRGGRGEAVSIIVGPNGSGKSSVLLEIAQRYRLNRNVAIICNTPHDRFVGLRGVKRVSVGRTDQSPKNVVKKAVAGSLNEAGSAFYQISSILDHCGYEARFGFKIEYYNPYEYAIGELRWRYSQEVSLAADDIPESDAALEMAISFLQRHDPAERIWIDARASVYEFSRASEFASVLKLESKLRRWGVIRGIRVLLERKNGDGVIEMQHASSGQLTLISSLLYLITNAGSDPLVIIDEPENSLHPGWQKEYVEKVLSALQFRNASVVVATHAPLIVTGALTDTPDIVSVFEVRNGIPNRLVLDSLKNPSSSIEEILWRAFDVVTPANHFVSEQIVAAMSKLEEGLMTKGEVLAIVNSMDRESFDPRQKRFFRAVKDLIDKVEASRNGTDDSDG